MTSMRFDDKAQHLRVLVINATMGEMKMTIQKSTLGVLLGIMTLLTGCVSGGDFLEISKATCEGRAKEKTGELHKSRI